MSKWVYNFGFGKAEGNASMRNMLGGKGANLAEMNKLGLAVPPGFTISTEVCDYYYKNDRKYPKELSNKLMLLLKKWKIILILNLVGKTILY